ncbi:TrmB family transcriptional regulator [Halobaculum sp. MBLA0143]|uniref:TrmB family transcriptional regulator n=1 Tax=Halobaculum sp. MBLA0143 TaxID=3079933 RepID=UPI0035250352
MHTAHASHTGESGEESVNAVAPESVTVPDTVSSPRAKLVYLYLATHGPVTESELCEGLDMKLISLYSVLGTLRDADLVVRDDGRYALV